MERIVEGLAHEATGQEPTLDFQPHQGTNTGRLALPRSAWRSFGTGARVAKFGFEGVKILQVFEEPSRHFRGGLAAS